MQWTNDPPTQKGWYFVRSARDHEDWSIKLTYTHVENGPLLVAIGMERFVTMYPMLEWLGPIDPSMIERTVH